MKTLYFMRHGQSETNAAHVYAGNTADIALTELGRQQAALGGHDLIGLKITKIYASPLVRAETTAEIVARELGYPTSDIVIDPRIAEIDVGSLTGQPDEGFGLGYAHIASGTDPDAETVGEVLNRVTSFLRDIAAVETETVLVVAHAGIGRVFRALLLGVTLESIAHTGLENAEPFELPLDLLHKVIA
jgi:broad specificity phosphatase PhoE